MGGRGSGGGGRMAGWGMARDLKPAGSAPSQASLHEAALRHLSRFATTEAGMVRVLDRRVQRWARLAEAEGAEVAGPAAVARAAVRAVARGLVAAGAIDDAAFAQARAGRLARAGRSRRATTAHLAAKGVAAGTAAAALPAEAEEVAAALAYARRRRIGPFRVEAGPTEADADPVRRQRDLAALGRAGFPREVAERALATTVEEAAARVMALKRG